MDLHVEELVEAYRKVLEQVEKKADANPAQPDPHLPWHVQREEPGKTDFGAADH